MTSVKPSLKYYHRFQPFISNPLWRRYLRWAYSKGLNDVVKNLHHQSPLTAKPNVLLCGVGSIVTAEEFIRFALNQAPQAKITIIDLRPDQILQIKHKVLPRFPHSDVSAKTLNALLLPQIIKEKSLDWIETDAIFEFFSTKDLRKLLKIWSDLLGDQGFATTRVIESNKLTDWLLLKFAPHWLHFNFYRHKTSELDTLFHSNHFHFFSGRTPIPYLRRYTLVPKS